MVETSARAMDIGSMSARAGEVRSVSSRAAWLSRHETRASPDRAEIVPIHEIGLDQPFDRPPELARRPGVGPRRVHHPGQGRELGVLAKPAAVVDLDRFDGAEQDLEGGDVAALAEPAQHHRPVAFVLQTELLEHQTDAVHPPVHVLEVADPTWGPEAFGDGGGARPDSESTVSGETYSAHMVASPPRIRAASSGVRGESAGTGSLR